MCVWACPQVRSDYMQQYASKVSDGMALQLGCLEIRYCTTTTARKVLKKEGFSSVTAPDLGKQDNSCEKSNAVGS